MRSRCYHVLLTAVLSVLSCHFLLAQVTSSPLFPTRDHRITIIYDATQGNGALVGVSPVYMHTGLITGASSSLTAWQYTQDNWATADDTTQMTSIGNNKWILSYVVDSFYKDFTNDTISQLAFVFRDVTGNIVGRAANGSDIYLPLYNDSLHCAFITPASGSSTSDTVDGTISFFCAASQSCTMTLYVNGNILTQGTNVDTFSYNNFTFLNTGQYHFVLRCTNAAGRTASDSVDVFVNVPAVRVDPPAGVIEGINYIDDSTVILELLAPYKSFVYALGDFNNYIIDSNSLMHEALDGQRYWLQVGHLTPMQKYTFQYAVDGSIRVGDPYSEEISDPYNDPYIPASIYANLPVYPTGKTTGRASVLQTAQVPYQWQDTTFVRPDKHNLVIYELLVRDFEPTDYYDRLRDSLPYLKALGINAIELMPVMNFESLVSWGYDPIYFGAPDKSYGDKASLKHFIDACHMDSMAVILDIPFNDAFGSCPMVQMYWDATLQEPAANNPWFNQVAPHPYSVGYDFNHNSTYTQNFVDRINAFWLREYHTDGYRFDLTKGYTQFYSGTDAGLWAQYDTMRVRLLERMVDKIWSVDTGAILIFEELADNDEELELQGHNKGIMLWGNINTNYTQCTEGYPSSNGDLSWASYEDRGFTNANLVSYMESHDEERLMYSNEQYGDSNSIYDVKSLDTALHRMECAGAVFFPMPGPKMLWMFGERGFDISINYNGRINPKPPHWEYMSNPNRLHLWKVWAALIKLKIGHPVAMNTPSYTINLTTSVKQIWWNDPTEFQALVVGNMADASQTVTPSFQHTGWWYNYMTGDSINVTNTAMTMTMAHGDYVLYTDKSLPVPDLSVPKVLGIDEVAATRDNITVFPQPSTGVVHFESEDDQPIQRVVIYDLQSRLVYDQSYTGGGSGVTVQIPESTTTGIYIYTVTVDNTIHTGKLSYVK